MNDWATIRYCGFYDVPRIFVVDYAGKTFLFSCPFDDKLDDYPDDYKVYVAAHLTEQDFEGNWEVLWKKFDDFVGHVRVKDVRFDSTRRRQMHTGVIESLLCASPKSD